MNRKDKVIHLKKNTTHTVDIVETYDGCSVVFTEDKKCFPIREVTSFKKIIYNWVLSVVFKKPITDELSTNFIKVLEEVGFIDKVKKIKMKPFVEKEFEKLLTNF